MTHDERTVMDVATVQIGTRVRFTRGPLGTLTEPNAYRFHEHFASKGDEGSYLGPHPQERLAEKDWHLVAIEHDGRTLYVPVHAGQFEVAS